MDGAGGLTAEPAAVPDVGDGSSVGAACFSSSEDTFQTRSVGGLRRAGETVMKRS
jgi:hypothetical protein